MQVDNLYGVKVMQPQMCVRLLPPAPPTAREILTNAAFGVAFVSARVLLTLILVVAATALCAIAGVPKLSIVAGFIIGMVIWAPR